MENEQLEVLRHWTAAAHGVFEAFTDARRAGFTPDAVDRYDKAWKELEQVRKDMDGIVDVPGQLPNEVTLGESETDQSLRG